MLKYTYTLLLIICCASIGYCQKTNTASGTAKRLFIKNEIDNKYRKNWGTCQLKGRVKTLIQYTYNNHHTSDSAAARSGPEEYIQYDSTGNLTMLIKQKENARPDRTTYKYNADNKWIEASFYSGNGITDFEQYNIFDAKGNLIEEADRYGDGSTDRKVVSEYDQHGGRTKATITGRVTEFINTYDKEGLLVVQKNLVNKKPDGKTTWKYDKIGRTIEKAEYNKDGSLLTRTNTFFNSSNLPDSMIFMHKGYHDQIMEFRYDSQGYVISQAVKDPRITIPISKTEYSYEFDSQGNWTKCVLYIAANDIMITTIRTIVYY